MQGGQSRRCFHCRAPAGEGVSIAKDLNGEGLDVQSPEFASNVAMLKSGLEMAFRRLDVTVPDDFGERFWIAMNQQLAARWLRRFKRSQASEATLQTYYESFQRILDGGEPKWRDDLNLVLKSINTRNRRLATQ